MRGPVQLLMLVGKHIPFEVSNPLTCALLGWYFFNREYTGELRYKLISGGISCQHSFSWLNVTLTSTKSYRGNTIATDRALYDLVRILQDQRSVYMLTSEQLTSELRTSEKDGDVRRFISPAPRLNSNVHFLKLSIVSRRTGFHKLHVTWAASCSLVFF